MMRQTAMAFVGMFATLLAIINPLEALPVFLRLLEGKSDEEHRQVARRSCLYAMGLMFFFLVFGTLILRLFGVPLSMVRIVGGIILVRIGFELFGSSASGNSMIKAGGGSGPADSFAFVPLAMPIMFGPGAIATILGMTSLMKHSGDEVVHLATLAAAIVATMGVTYLTLAYARRLTRRIGAKGIDAATRIVGFFVSAIGMGLIFHGVIDALQEFGVMRTS